MDSYLHLRSVENPNTPNWCSSFASMMELLGSTEVWSSHNLALARENESQVMHKLRTILRASDLNSTRNSSTMPHYCGIKRHDVLVEPYLQNLPKYLATCMAQIRLGYPILYNKGHWHKLGSLTDDPCRFCGMKESLNHILEECAGYNPTRVKYLEHMTSFSNALDLLQCQNWTQELSNIYYFLCYALNDRPHTP